MKKINVSPDLYTRKPAMPMFLKGGESAVLLLHGYNGYAYDLDFIARKLNSAGFTVSVPRLSGHGTSSEDFLSTGADMWLRSAIDAYLDMKGMFKEVHVCGLSMGGLLALILSSMFNIKKIALMAPVLKNRSRNIKFTPFLKYFIKKQNRKWNRIEKDEDDAFLAEEYWCWNYTQTAAELLKLQKLCLKKLKSVKSDVFTIVSHADLAVPVEVVDIIEKNVQSSDCEKLILTESPHVMSQGPEKEVIADRIIDWFKK